MENTLLNDISLQLICQLFSTAGFDLTTNLWGNIIHVIGECVQNVIIMGTMMSYFWTGPYIILSLQYNIKFVWDHASNQV